jgi:hypothetical protein
MNSPTASLSNAAKGRGRALLLGALLATLAATPASAKPLGFVTPDQWQPHAQVGILERVTLNIHWHDSLALLREAAAAHDVDDTDLHGFSILRRTAAGDWICDVFVLRMRGALVDNDRTMTFGHEMLHCFGYRHE